jgi:hypothetical protein
MLIFTNQDFWSKKADILICPCNTVGVQGAGLAKEFKKRYPEVDQQYREDCKAGKFKPGDINVYWPDDESHYLLYVFTKDHWKDPSKSEWIKKILENMYRMFIDYGPNVSILLPAIGCGLGGLDYQLVKAMIKQYLTFLEPTIYVFEPKS